jgi:hypothetical protein
MSPAAVPAGVPVGLADAGAGVIVQPGDAAAVGSPPQPVLGWLEAVACAVGRAVRCGEGDGWVGDAQPATTAINASATNSLTRNSSSSVRSALRQ